MDKKNFLFLKSMQTKLLLTRFLTLLFVLHLMSGQMHTIYAMVTGKEVSVVHPFCKKLKAQAAQQEQVQVQTSSDLGIVFASLCTSVFDFDQAFKPLEPKMSFFKPSSFYADEHKEPIMKDLDIPPQY